ncbi:MAG: hypothetical protein SCARUB_04818 [Candidatus Scalindua rubra]|uniref:Uncharacterized protein n=1 Tax=Candidatus Scalindua rubra TaxID=1872076 RepID=A0A1E3X357_9BACT|nr:MAG: hypothetical protein SCARUB_04818 [Candidatus Scalindua rubra]
MFDKDNVTENYGSGKSIQELMNAAEIVSACGKDVQRAVGTIIQSCLIVNNKGATYKDVLLAKVDDLKKLAELYRSASGRFKSAAQELKAGKPEDKVLNDVQAYNVFFRDQLKSEQSELEHILSMLRV